jgi:hypothetical protein
MNTNKQVRGQEFPSMNIYSNRGTKVVFCFPKNGYPSDQDQANKYLIVGQIYTVDWIDVNSCSSSVHLVEVSGVSFNSVLFGSLDFVAHYFEKASENV